MKKINLIAGLLFVLLSAHGAMAAKLKCDLSQGLTFLAEGEAEIKTEVETTIELAAGNLKCRGSANPDIIDRQWIYSVETEIEDTALNVSARANASLTQSSVYLETRLRSVQYKKHSCTCYVERYEN